MSTPVIVGGILLLLLLMRRAPDVRASRSDGDILGGAPALLPAVGAPGNIVPLPSEGFLRAGPFPMVGEPIPATLPPPSLAINPPQTTRPVVVAPRTPLFQFTSGGIEAGVAGASTHRLVSISKAF